MSYGAAAPGGGAAPPCVRQRPRFSLVIHCLFYFFFYQQEAQPPPPPKEAPREPTEKTPTITEKSTSLIPSRDSDILDYTKIPSKMEAKFDELDEDSALRPTIIKAGNSWEKKAQKALLAPPQTSTLGSSDHARERNKVYIFFIIIIVIVVLLLLFCVF